MKTITGHPLVRKSNIRENHTEERMDDIVSIVSPYFQRCVTHYYCEEMPRNTFCCYTNVELNANVIRTINLSLNDVLIERLQNKDRYDCYVFFDDKIKNRSYCNSFDVVRIEVAGRFAGYYVPTCNTLLGTDWTHSRDSLQIFDYIWPQLVEKLGLQPNMFSTDEVITIKEITVGCDPEFELIDQDGEVIEAGEVIDDSDNDESIGLDGTDDQVEIRPRPGTPAQVVRNIKKLIGEFAEEHPSYDLSDEGDFYPLGGHIHIGVGETICPDHELVVLLDDFIGAPTIDLSGTAREDYKRLGAVRKQPWGFEYRSMPAAVFQNPIIAHCVLKVAKNLCAKYFAGETFVYNEEPTNEDYITIGGLTKKQADIFTKFVAHDFRPVKSICAAWKVPKPVVAELTELGRSICNATTNVTIRFRDHWSTTARRYISEKARNIVSERPITVVFYGLSRDRGDDVCTLANSLCETLEHGDSPFPTWQDGNQILNIGIARNRRDSNVTNTFVGVLIRAINQEISRRTY